MAEPLRVETPQPRYTYGDYVQWRGPGRFELVGGEAIAMSPAPGRLHQMVVGSLFGQLREQLRGLACTPYVSPIDVRLPEAGEADERVADVLQPDVLVVCDPAKEDDAGVRGAPEFVAEVLSRSSEHHDRVVKAALYEHHGVREYWIVDIARRVVEVRRLSPSGRWGEVETYAAEGTLALASVPGATIDLAALLSGD